MFISFDLSYIHVTCCGDTNRLVGRMVRGTTARPDQTLQRIYIHFGSLMLIKLSLCFHCGTWARPWQTPYMEPQFEFYLVKYCATLFSSALEKLRWVFYCCEREIAVVDFGSGGFATEVHLSSPDAINSWSQFASLPHYTMVNVIPQAGELKFRNITTQAPMER